MEPLPGQYDLILCQNVLIYFTPEAQCRAYRHLAAGLRAGGRLLVAPSDPKPDAASGLVSTWPDGVRVLRRAVDVGPVEARAAAPVATADPKPDAPAPTPQPDVTGPIYQPDTTVRVLRKGWAALADGDGRAAGRWARQASYLQPESIGAAFLAYMAAQLETSPRRALHRRRALALLEGRADQYMPEGGTLTAGQMRQVMRTEIP